MKKQTGRNKCIVNNTGGRRKIETRSTCLLRNKHFVWLYVSGVEKSVEGFYPY